LGAAAYARRFHRPFFHGPLDFLLLFPHDFDLFFTKSWAACLNLLIFVYHVFGRFSVRGVQKHD
jgi:hypothetical protein